MGIGFQRTAHHPGHCAVLFGAKKLRNVGSDLGAAVRGFKKAVNEGDDESASN